MATLQPRQYDLVLFGATGYTGKLAFRHLLNEYVVGSQKGKLRFAIAGRSRSRLERVVDDEAKELGIDKKTLLDSSSSNSSGSDSSSGSSNSSSSSNSSNGSSPSSVGLIIADSNDINSLKAMCRSTKVVITTVGPFIKVGEPLVVACLEEGCHYCDITGEVHFVRSMVEKYQQKAEAKGTKIVSFCGFDCIPSEMGTAFLQAEAVRLFKRPCEEVRTRITVFRGGFSGGTVDSMLLAIDAASDNNNNNSNGHNALFVTTPFYKKTQLKTPSVVINGVKREPDCGNVLPFILCDVSSAVVRWTSGLLGGAYGEKFRYSEGLALGMGNFTAAFWSAVMKSTLLLLSCHLTRPLVRWLLPSAGSGPSAASLSEGAYHATIYGSLPPTSDDPQRHYLTARVSFRGDPGYLWAGRFVAECGAMLAIREEETANSGRGGFFSPGAGIGVALIPQLLRCGFTIGISEYGSHRDVIMSAKETAKEK